MKCIYVVYITYIYVMYTTYIHYIYICNVYIWLPKKWNNCRLLYSFEKSLRM